MMILDILYLKSAYNLLIKLHYE